MMKKIRFFVLFLLIGVNGYAMSFALAIPGSNPNQAYDILNQQENTIVTVGDEAWRDGAYDAIHADNGKDKIENLINSNDKITSQGEAHNKVLYTIWRIVNFALGFLSLIAFVILLTAGGKMVLGAGDDKAQGEGKAALLKVVKALGGIALSWMIISLIFWVIDTVFF